MDLDERDKRAAILQSHLSGPEREALDRFYNGWQSPSRICSEMRISRDQFQMLKRCVRSHYLRLGSSTWAELHPRVPFCMN